MAGDPGYERLRSCLEDFLGASTSGAALESETGSGRDSESFRKRDSEDAWSLGSPLVSRQPAHESTSLPAAILDELYASLLRNRVTGSSRPQSQGGLSFEVLSGWGIDVPYLASCLKRSIDDANEDALQEEGAALAEDDQEHAEEGEGAGLSGSKKTAEARKGRKMAVPQSRGRKAGGGDAAQGASLTGLKASACYMMLLALPGCPAFSLFNSTALVSIVSSIRRGIRSPAALCLDLSSQTHHRAIQRASASGPEAPPSPWNVLQGLEAVLAVAPLRDTPDGFRTIVELLVEALPFSSQIPCAPGGAKGKATASQKQAVEARLAVVISVFQKLLEPEHGDQSENAVHILRSLASQVLLPQLDGTNISRHGLSSPVAAMDKARAAALGFVTSQEVCSTEHGAAAVAATARFLCLHTADRAECRAATVTSVIKMLQSLSEEQQHSFHVFALKLAQNPKPALRVMALEVGIALLEKRLGLAATTGVPAAVALGGVGAQAAKQAVLSTPTGPKTTGDSAEADAPVEGQEGEAHSSPARGPAASPEASGAAEVLEGAALVHAWLRCWKRRVRDTAAAVKCRALGTLGQAVRLSMEAVAELEEFELPAGNQAVRGQVELQESTGKPVDHRARAQSGDSVSEFAVRAVPLVRGALGDEKSAVRRAASGALVALLSATATVPADEDLAALGSLCSDPLVSLRKSGLTGLSELTQCFPGNASIARAWWERCLPLVVDNEVSAQDQLLQVLSTNVLSLITESTKPTYHGKPSAKAGLSARTGSHVFTSGDSALGSVKACLSSLESTCNLCPRGNLFCSCRRCGGEREPELREDIPGNKENDPSVAAPDKSPSAASPTGSKAAKPTGSDQHSEQPANAAVGALAWLIALGKLRSGRMQSLLQKAVARVQERKLLPLPPLVKSVQAVIECAEGHLGQHTGNSGGATGLTPSQAREASWRWSQVLKGSWLLLTVLSQHSPQGPSWEFLESRWHRGAGDSTNPQSQLPTAPDPGLDPPLFEGGSGSASVLTAGVPSFHPGSGLPSPPLRSRHSPQAGPSPYGGWSLAGASHRADVLHVISAVATAFPRERASEIAATVKRNLLRMSLGTEEVEAHLSALLTLTYQAHEEEQPPPSKLKAKGPSASSQVSAAPELRRAREAIRKWSTEIFHKAKGVLQAYIKRPGQGLGAGQGTVEGSERAAQGGDTVRVEAALFTVGNLALMLHSAWDSEASDSASAGPSAAGAKRKSRQAGTSGSEVEALVPQVLLHLIIELGTSNTPGDETQRTLRFELGDDGSESDGESELGEGECVQEGEHAEEAVGRTGGVPGSSPVKKKARRGGEQGGGAQGEDGGVGGTQATDAQELEGTGADARGAGEENNEGRAGGDGIERERVAAQAWLALGRLCLMHHEYASRCVPIFIQELERSKSSAIRNNIAICLSDLCECYTALVDRYIPILAACITDESVTVRHQMIARLVSLLQGDFVKWRGPVVFHLMLALDDEAPQVRDIANHVFRNIVPHKAPLLCYTHFVEAVFWLNGVKLSRARATAAQTDGAPTEGTVQGNASAPSLWEAARKEGSPGGRQFRRLSPGGAHKPKLARENRMVVYRTLLSSMAMEHRLALSAKLCAEIVAQVLEDGKLSLDAPADRGAVQDALELLGTKEMRQGANSRGGAQGGPEDAAEVEATERGEASGAATAARQRTRVMTQLMKHQLVENTIPIMIELKRLLEFRVDALQGPLMACLRSLFADFKAEIDDLLAADPQLAKELKYDIQKHEAQQARAAAAAALAASGAGARGTPGAGRTSGTPAAGGTPGGGGRGTPSGGQRNGQGTPTLGEAATRGKEVPGPFHSPRPSPSHGTSGASHKAHSRTGAVAGGAPRQGVPGTPVAAASGREGTGSEAAARQEGAEGQGNERHIATAEEGTNTGGGSHRDPAPRRSARLQPGPGKKAQEKGPLKDQSNRRGKAKGVPQGADPGAGATAGSGAEGSAGPGGGTREPGRKGFSSFGAPNSRPSPGAEGPKGRGVGERPGALLSPAGRHHQPGTSAGSGSARGTPRAHQAGAGPRAGAGAGAATPSGGRGSTDGTPMGAAKMCSLMFSTPLPPSGGGGSRKTMAGSASAKRDGMAEAGGRAAEALFRERETDEAREGGEEGRGRREESPEESAAAAVAAVMVAAEVLNDAATGKGTPALGSMAVPRVRSSSSASASKDSGSGSRGSSVSMGRESSVLRDGGVGDTVGGLGKSSAQKSPTTTKLFEGDI